MDRFVAAGARYFVAQAVHHDNFLNYDSALHRWNSVKVGPGRDIVAAWRDAADARGLPFGLSEHLGASLQLVRGEQGRGQERAVQGRPVRRIRSELRGPLSPQPGAPQQESGARTGPVVHAEDPGGTNAGSNLVTEMIDQFQPDLLYCDGPLPFEADGHAAGAQAVAHLYNTSAAIHSGINRAVYTQKTRDPKLAPVGVFDIERSQEPDIRPEPWQTDTSVGGLVLQRPRRLQDRRSRDRDARRHRIEERQPAAQRPATAGRHDRRRMRLPARRDGADGQRSAAKASSAPGPSGSSAKGPAKSSSTGFTEEQVSWTSPGLPVHPTRQHRLRVPHALAHRRFDRDRDFHTSRQGAFGPPARRGRTPLEAWCGRATRDPA